MVCMGIGIDTGAGADLGLKRKFQASKGRSFSTFDGAMVYACQLSILGRTLLGPPTLGTSLLRLKGVPPFVGGAKEPRVNSGTALTRVSGRGMGKGWDGPLQQAGPEKTQYPHPVFWDPLCLWHVCCSLAKGK
uniref:Uncharacterized protein n=1 Tax=Eutreptiella gymnastica TaxID=73025 RepID=A0A7S4LIQ5_9EUGL